jgi:hypothetical protein
MGDAPTRKDEILLGVPNISEDGSLGYSAPVDAVSEVKVEAFQVDAAFGHTGGGTGNVVTKGGTNVFRGSAYEYNQVSAVGIDFRWTGVHPDGAGWTKQTLLLLRL